MTDEKKLPDNVQREFDEWWDEVGLDSLTIHNQVEELLHRVLAAQDTGGGDGTTAGQWVILLNVALASAYRRNADVILPTASAEEILRLLASRPPEGEGEEMMWRRFVCWLGIHSPSSTATYNSWSKKHHDICKFCKKEYLKEATQ